MNTHILGVLASYDPVSFEAFYDFQQDHVGALSALRI